MHGCCIATTNPNKVREIRPLLRGSRRCELVTLADLPPIPEPEETGATFWENARLKALAYARRRRARRRRRGLRPGDRRAGRRARRALGALPRRRRHLSRALRGDLPPPRRHARRGAHRALRDRAAPSPTATTRAVRDRDARSRARSPTRQPGTHGFGYDPIFFYPPFGKTTGELTLDGRPPSRIAPARSATWRAARAELPYLSRYPFAILRPS